MGILNVTPDSFSDGGKFIDLEKAVKQAKKMVAEGADIIDVGGESTRPGAHEVSAEEELKRVLPVVQRLVKEIDVPISVDTYKSEVAEEALRAGAHMINDVWGMQKDPEMASVVAKYGVPVIVMHNQKGTEYQGDIIEEICKFFRKSIQLGTAAGIKREKIILDPGIGFGKTPEQNILVMSRLGELNDLGHPILLGTSRKSMIGKILDLPSGERVEGTLATTVMGIIQGVDIVRVHDVKENMRAAKVADAIVRGE
jgi:dihydropteroate synthase